MRATRTASGYTLLELLVVIAIIILLLAGLVTLLGRLKEGTRRKDAAKQIAQVQNGLEAYHFKYRAFPPDNAGGRSGSQSLVYFLTTTFSKTPDASRGEVQAAINSQPFSSFQERELADPVTVGSKTLVDPWRNPVQYKLELKQYPDTANPGQFITVPTPVVYSFGPNGVDDNGAGDDITH